MLPCHNCYVYRTWRSKEVGEFKVIVWREAEEGNGSLFMGKLTLQVFYQRITYLFQPLLV